MSCGDAVTEPLLPYPEALKIVLANVQPVGAVTVPVMEALGAYLAAAAVAGHDSPRFEQAAMDGYAVRLADVEPARPGRPVTLRLAGELPAGDRSALILEPGRTIKVYTGSRLPGGAEAVVMKEFVTLRGDRAAIARRVEAGDHIRRVGEEFRRGEEILPAGTRVTPPVVGMLAFLGRERVAVGRRPRATVVTMGDELVALGAEPGPGQVHDANGPAVVAALRSVGLTEVTHVCVPDDPGRLRDAMAASLAAGEVLITVGGASVGDHDFVPGARAALGVRELVTGVAVKPGKPLLFGLAPDGTPVFGLPGNPVSALVSFHQLVRPALARMMGAAPRAPRRLPVTLQQGVTKQKGRLNWLRGILSFDPQADGALGAELVSGQGSHMLSGLARAEVLVEIPSASDGARRGDSLVAVPLNWFE